MAPQRFEKIESGPGNGRASDASKLQHLVRGRAADRALRLCHTLKSQSYGPASRGGSVSLFGSGNFCCFFLSEKDKL
jgi:hypothetical protein